MELQNYSCIDIYAYGRLKPFSVGQKAVFKQQNPCSNHEVHMLFEHGFCPKSIEVIGQYDVIHRNKMADVEEALWFFGDF